MFPLGGGALQLAMAGLGEFVEFCLAVVFRRAPTGADEALLLEFEQSGVERAVVQLQQIAAGLLDAARQAVAVLRAHGVESAQDHETEGSLPDIGFVAHCLFPSLLVLPTNRKNVLQLLWECNTKDSRAWFHEVFL